jgi:hypothetical protein
LRRYNTNSQLNALDDIALYKFYSVNNNKEFPLDAEYYKLYYDIKDCEEFDWKIYLECYKEYFDINNKSMNNVFNHYYLKKYEELSESNIKYYKKIYNINEDFDYVNYLNLNKCFIFQDNIQYILKIYKKQILLEDIYKNIVNNTKTVLQEKFISNYKFLIQNFSQINTEDDKRFYINLKEFINDYYYNVSEPKVKVTNSVQLSEDIIMKPIEKIVTKKREKIVNKNTENTNSQPPNLEILKTLALKNNINFGNIMNNLNKSDNNNVINSNNIIKPHVESIENTNSQPPNLEILKTLASKNNINLDNIMNNLNNKETTNNTETVSNTLVCQNSSSSEAQNIIKTPKINSRFKMPNMALLLSSLNSLNTSSNTSYSNNTNHEPEIEYEYYDETITEYVEEKIVKNIVVEKKERAYNSFDYNFKMESYNNIYDELQTITHNLYYIYRLKDYIYYALDNKTINIKNISENCSIFYTFNKYPHTILTFINNYLKLGDNWSHHIVCCLSNQEYIKNILHKFNLQQINIIVLPYTDITYNEFNQTLLTREFWQNFNCETILLHNENTFILGNKINNFLNNDALGYKLPIIFSYNKYRNGYSDISIRKKKSINNFLDNINNINIGNKLCIEIKEYFSLEKFPEDILYSKYVYDSNNDNDNDNDNDNSINDFDDNLLIANYKFLFVDTLLKSDIKEFSKKNIKIKNLEKYIL